MIYDWAAFLVLSGLLLAGAAALVPTKWPRALRRAVVLAVAVRIVASTARLAVIQYYYGRGDAIRYFDVGSRLADNLRAWEFDEFFYGQLWGSPFIDRIAGVVILFVGPSIRATFLVFSVLPLIGLVLMCLTFARSFPWANTERFTSVLLFWPSLWFWPSSIGKESIIILAVGLIAYGYVGSGKTIRWGFLVCGLCLAMGVRPHIAILIAISIAAAEWAAPAKAWSVSHLARGFALAVVAIGTVSWGLGQFGLDPGDFERIQDFVRFRSGQTSQGRSQIQQVTGVLLVPMSFVNVFLRPFLWEARNPFILFAAIETIVLWVLIFRDRRRVWATLRSFREHRLLRLTIPVGVVLIVFYGGFVSNLGILARQRVVILPFIFVVVVAAAGLARHVPRARQAGRMYQRRTG